MWRTFQMSCALLTTTAHNETIVRLVSFASGRGGDYTYNAIKSLVSNSPVDCTPD